MIFFKFKDKCGKELGVQILKVNTENIHTFYRYKKIHDQVLLCNIDQVLLCNIITPEKGSIYNVYLSISVQGSVVQSIVNLTSLLVDKMLTVIVSTISNSQVFAENM